MHFGVDVSTNNRHPIAWPALVSHLRALGNGDVPFVVIKVIQGTGYVDPDLAIDIAGAREQGAVVAGYLMDQGNDNVAAEEALFQRTCSLPQADDIELPEGLSVAAYIAHSHDLVNLHPAELSYLNQSEVSEGFPEGEGLWLAQFNKKPGVTAYPCWMHQYDDAGTIPGASGIFDMDAWCGSEAQFDAFFNSTPIPSPSNPTTVPEDLFTMLASDPAFAVRYLYRVCLHREADAAGFATQVNILNQGGTLNQVMANLQDSAEGQAVIAAERKALGL